ncbi:MAG: DUF1295 domain-containing protein [Bdellovibrionales bacterium]
MFPDPRIIVAYASGMNALEAYLFVGSFMLLLWIYSRARPHAFLADVGLAVSFTIVAAHALYRHEVHNPKLIALSVMFILWSVRWTSLILKNQNSSTATQKPSGWKSFLFFQWRALLAVLLALPLYIVRFDPKKEILLLQSLAILIWIIGLVGDMALQRTQRKIKYPYLFAWLMPFSYFVFAFSSPLGSTTLIVPLFMFYFLKKNPTWHHTKK